MWSLIVTYGDLTAWSASLLVGKLFLQRGLSFLLQWLRCRMPTGPFKYLAIKPSAKGSQESVSALVLPYASGVPRMHPQQLLHNTYMKHPAVHGLVPKPLVCFKKNRNLGSWLVRAGA